MIDCGRGEDTAYIVGIDTNVKYCETTIGESM